MSRPAPIAPVPPDLVVPLGGRSRVQPEDFQVEELPLYGPSGDGEHLMLLVEKRGLTTPGMVQRLARALGVSARDAGWAGLKDRDAVTRQWITLPRAQAPDALCLDLPGLRVIEAARHKNRLRIGHLRGNRFRITLRGCDEARIPAARDLLRTLQGRGLPNGYGEQRFGRRGDGHLLGEMIVRRQGEELLRHLARPDPGSESPRLVAARAHLERGEWKAALVLLPHEMALERHVARVLQHGGSPQDAARTLGHRLRRLLVSAWQSEAFNRLLAARIQAYDLLLTGDVAWKHDSGASFLVLDAEREGERTRSLEISPSGPLPGPRLLRPEGQPRALEDAALAASGFSDLDQLEPPSRKIMQGARRPLRAIVGEATLEHAEPDVALLGFTLPAGAFATSLLACFGVTPAHGGRRAGPGGPTGA